MSLFNLLTWNNNHMNLRYNEDDLYGTVNITNIYEDNRYVNINKANEKYNSTLLSAQRAITSNRIIMLLLFTILVFLPALVIGIVTSNILLIGGIIVYSIVAYFVLEAINQVQINKVLYDISNDEEIHTQP